MGNRIEMKMPEFTMVSYIIPKEVKDRKYAIRVWGAKQSKEGDKFVTRFLIYDGDRGNRNWLWVNSELYVPLESVYDVRITR